MSKEIRIKIEDKIYELGQKAIEKLKLDPDTYFATELEYAIKQTATNYL